MKQEVCRWSRFNGSTLQTFITNKIEEGWLMQNMYVIDTQNGEVSVCIIVFFKAEENENITIKLF